MGWNIYLFLATSYSALHWGAGLSHRKWWKLFADLDRHNVYKKTKDSLIYIPNTSNSVVRFLWKESQVGEERKLKYFQAWDIFLIFGLQCFLKLNLAENIKVWKPFFILYLFLSYFCKKWEKLFTILCNCQKNKRNAVNTNLFSDKHFNFQ